jgi:hypothetical protein
VTARPGLCASGRDERERDRKVPSPHPVTATLRIRSTLDTSMPTSFYVDSLSLKVSCTP